MRGAIIAAGGPSRRMRRFKPLVDVAGVPLVLRVVEAAKRVADEVVVVTKPSRAKSLRAIMPAYIPLVQDGGRLQSPLVALIAGAASISSEYCAFFACDLPLLSDRLIDLLFASAKDHDAAIPRWPDGRIEPMVAVYRRAPASAAAQEALSAGELANTDMIRRLSDVVYVGTEGLRGVDLDLESFLNVNTPADIRSAEARIRKRTASPR